LWDPVWKILGSGSGIKHPGSATLCSPIWKRANLSQNRYC
jgi:hypothetical protein